MPFLAKAQELQSIIDGITEPIFLVGDLFSLRRLNKSALQFSGNVEFSEVLGKKCHEIFYNRVEVCPYCPLYKEWPNNDKFNTLFPKTKNGRKPIIREIFHKINDKNRILRLELFALEQEGEVYSIVEMITDITPIKEKEEESLRMRNLASLGIMISGIAHELNNPLTGISLTLQNIQNQSKNISKEVLENKLSLIKEDVIRAANIVSDIISFAKSERLNLSLADISESIFKAKEVVSRLYPALSQNINWEFKFPAENMIFPFNPLKIERLFINLFRNSLQAFDYNSGTISIELKRTKTRMQIIIEDDAGGIPEEILDKIFDPFFSQSKSETGTGLGLSITHNIVTEHKGSISVKTIDNRTRFLISIPTNLHQAKA
jgi:signal transduction histidine kinase